MSVNAVDQTTGNTTPLAGNTNNLVGNLSALTTNTKSDAVGAINEVNQTKQNATDNNLQTTDKTIVGGINELRSGLTNETLLLNQTLTSTGTIYNLNGLVDDYMFIAFIIGWYGGDTNDNMIVMPSLAFSSSDYLLIPRKNDVSTQAYAKINRRGYADGANYINAEGTEGVSIKVVGIIHK